MALRVIAPRSLRISSKRILGDEATHSIYKGSISSRTPAMFDSRRLISTVNGVERVGSEENQQKSSAKEESQGSWWEKAPKFRTEGLMLTWIGVIIYYGEAITKINKMKLEENAKELERRKREFADLRDKGVKLILIKEDGKAGNLYKVVRSS